MLCALSKSVACGKQWVTLMSRGPHQVSRKSLSGVGAREAPFVIQPLSSSASMHSLRLPGQCLAAKLLAAASETPL